MAEYQRIVRSSPPPLRRTPRKRLITLVIGGAWAFCYIGCLLVWLSERRRKGVSPHRRAAERTVKDGRRRIPGSPLTEGASDMALGLNAPGTGTVASNSFNLTRIMNAIAIAVGLVATGSGVGASQDNKKGEIDWAGFNEHQRFIIIVAAIAAVAIITSADMLARALATFGVSRADIVTLAGPRAAMKRADDAQGQVVALRATNPPSYLFLDTDASPPTTQWLAEAEVKFIASKG